MVSNSLITDQIKQELTVFDDPAYSSAAFARSLVKQIEGMTFPTGNLLAMRLEFHGFLDHVRLYGNVGAGRLRRAALQLLHRAQGLARPFAVPQPGDDCAADIAAVLKALDDPALTAEAFARLMINRIAVMTFLPERASAVRNSLRSYENYVRTLLLTDDAAGLRHETQQLYRRAQDLTRPVRVPSPEDVVNRICAGLRYQGWASATIDLLRQELKAGEEVLRYDADSLTTDKRKIDRLEFIEKTRPASWTKIETWRAMHTRDAALYLRPAPESER